jgi:hypothetical protein
MSNEFSQKSCKSEELGEFSLRLWKAISYNSPSIRMPTVVRTCKPWVNLFS